MLRNISITRKILSLVVVGVLCIAAVAAYGLYHLKEVMIADRQAAVKVVVEEAIGVASFYQKQVASGGLSDDAAQTQAKAVIRSLRFGDGGYAFVYSLDGTNLVQGVRPELEGQNRLNDTDTQGRHYIQHYITEAQAGGGFTHYSTQKQGHDKAEQFEKVSYSGLFQPWGWVISSGVYIDDIDAAFLQQALTLGGGVLAAIILLMAVSFYIGRSITSPISAMAANMRALAAGDLGIEIDSGRRDEIGGMAKAVQVFKETTIAKQEADERERQNQERRVVVAQRLESLTQRFDGVATGALGAVNSAASSLHRTSEGMSQTASRTSAMAGQVAAAAAETSSNVQTVASAAEELAASIREISSQVSESSRIAAEAVSEADHTTGQVQALAEAADKIGAVVNLISQIANQTNLLALNATIEAARAGDAGKGFAVVASEVKQLANQTAKATTDIASQITLIQAETGAAVKAISGISDTVRRIDSISAGISAAVEEQGAATQEIARSVQQAANGARHVMETIGGVESAAEETKTMAHNVLSSSSHLGEQCDSLKGSVVEFLDGVRAS